MALRAFFDLATSCLWVQLTTRSKSPNASIIHYSRKGFLLESHDADGLTIGMAVDVMFSDINRQSARVSWAGPGIVGCLFTASEPDPLWEQGTVAIPASGDAISGPVPDRRSHDKSLGARLRRLRRQRGFRQEAVATALGVSTASVSHWEADRTIPKPARLAEIASLLGVPVDELAVVSPQAEVLANIPVDVLRSQLALTLGVEEAHLRIMVEVAHRELPNEEVQYRDSGIKAKP